MFGKVSSKFRKTFLAAMAAPLIITSAAVVPAQAGGLFEIYWYRITWFSDASKTNVVGYADGWCEGRYEEHGQQTVHSTIVYFAECP
ncbi:hypothetical protein [Sphingomonas koreensis]|nr:hypothetical protein [Sphingomonas koreensis]